MPTIEKIAEMAEVSPATVSRVFNDKGNVSEITRKKIMEIAEKLDFKPRQYNKRNQNGDVKNIVVINRFLDVMSNIFYSQIMGGIEKGLREHGYKFNLVFKTIENRNVNDVKSFKSLLNHQDFSGIILIGYGIKKELIEKINDFIDIPLILVDNNFWKYKNVNCIVNDNFFGTKRIVQQLIKWNHKDIGFLGGPEGHGSMVQRYKGYLEALEDSHIEKKNEFIKFISTSELTINTGYETGKRYLNNLKYLPSTLIAANDELAIGFMKAAKEFGLSIPGDISVAGFDDIKMAEHTSPSLTTVKVYKKNMGMIVSRRLCELIEGKDIMPLKITVPVKPIFRESTKKYEK